MCGAATLTATTARAILINEVHKLSRFPVLSLMINSGVIDHACSVSGSAAPSVTDVLETQHGKKMRRYPRDLAHVEGTSRKKWIKNRTTEKK